MTGRRIDTMIHWLQIGGIKERNENKQWDNLSEYLNKYPESKIEVWVKFTGDMYAKFIKLECNQTYHDLDLLCNSCSNGSIKHLNNKPSNIELSSHSGDWFIEYYKNKNMLIKQ
jgi:hypothetical protein